MTTGRKILVANLGSTSFKYRLFDMTDERQLARGGVERIGDRAAAAVSKSASSAVTSSMADVPDHAVAVRHVPGATDRPGPRVPGRRRRGGGDRIQGRSRRTRQRCAAGHAGRAGGDGAK